MERESIASQAEAAARLGITQQEVSDYVTWRHVPRPAKLVRLADLTGADRGDFIPDRKSRRIKVA